VALLAFWCFVCSIIRRSRHPTRHSEWRVKAYLSFTPPSSRAREDAQRLILRLRSGVSRDLGSINRISQKKPRFLDCARNVLLCQSQVRWCGFPIIGPVAEHGKEHVDAAPG